MNTKLMIRYCVISMVLIMMGCATKHDLLRNDSAATFSIAAATHPAIRDAMQAILAGNPEQANDILNRVLGHAPRNPLMNLINGMAYQSRAAGEGQYWDMAKVGYQLAHQFDPYLWQAPYLLGLMYMHERNFAAAIMTFSDAALVNPRTAMPLYGLAAASYSKGDVTTAYRAIQQALRLDNGKLLPQNRYIIALCLAATGNVKDATSHIEALKATNVASWETQRLEQKVRMWQEFYTHPEMIPPNKSQNGNDNKPEESSTENAKAPRMALLEAIIVRISGTDSFSRGVNLLEGLSVQFEGSLVSTGTKETGTGAEGAINEDSDNTERTLSLSIPGVKYTLNIVNTANSSSRLEGHPSILALDGKESKIFVGSSINLMTGGDWDSVFEKEFGLSIATTPTFLSDEVVQLEVATEFSILGGGAPPTTGLQGLSVDKMTTHTSAVMRFGQTLIVASGTIQDENSNNSGVPVLNKIPIVDNLFSSRNSRLYKGSVLVLLNLKSHSASESNVQAERLLVNNQAFLRIQQHLPVIASPVEEQLQKLQSRDVLTLINPNDAVLPTPIQTAWQEQLSQQWQKRFMQEVLDR